MENVEVKFIVIEVDGEAVLKFPIYAGNPSNVEMVNAVLASSPVLRLVDAVEIGKTWNGTEYK